MSFHKVKASQLNLRRTPEVINGNIVAVLPNGQRVEKIEAIPDTQWWRIRTTLQGTSFEGFVSAQFLEEEEAALPAEVNLLMEIHLDENNTAAARNKKEGRAFPLNESGQPTRIMTSAESQILSIGSILDWLDVERSDRYLPASGSTFCNIYTYDFCFLSGAYLPRVWWSEQAIRDLGSGRAVVPQYAKTIFELNANALLNWLKIWGTNFGWQRVNSETALQDAANQGQLGLIVAQRIDLNRSSHIVAVVPETGTFKAKRDVDNKVIIPLQSQAGVSNRKYFRDRKWWTDSKFREFVFFIHD